MRPQDMPLEKPVTGRILGPNFAFPDMTCEVANVRQWEDKMIFRASVTVAIIALCSSTGVVAQQDYTADDVPVIEELVPLSEYLSRPVDEQIPSYLLQRCSGLHLGYKYYTGATFDEQTRELNDQNIESFRLVAAYVELARNAKRLDTEVNDLPDSLLNDLIRNSSLQIEGFAFFYDDRMRENYLSDGAAFSEDSLILSDLEICGAHSEEVRSISNALSEKAN